MKRFNLILRSAVFYLLLILICAVCWVVMLFTAFSPFRWRYNTARWACKTIILLAKEICGISYEVEGEEYISENAVVLSKHQSAWETLFFMAYFKQPVSYMLKRELLFIPFVGWGMFLLQMIPIDRSKKSFQKAYRKAFSLLEKGRSIIIFPEGTRAFPGQSLPFKAGGAVLACKTQHPVIPVTLNTGFFWKKGDWIKQPGTVRVQFFPPIETGPYKPSDLIDKVKSIIDESTQKLEAETLKRNACNEKACMG